MAITRIQVSNFKSFRKLDTELGSFNVLIGANASGKSNFVQAFQFLKDTGSFGLDSAISMQGGLRYLMNMRAGMRDEFSMTLASDQRLLLPFGMGEGRKAPGTAVTYELSYEFAIRRSKSRDGFIITKDKFTVKFAVPKKKQLARIISGGASLRSYVKRKGSRVAQVEIEKIRRRLRIIVRSDTLQIQERDLAFLIPYRLVPRVKLQAKRLLLEPELPLIIGLPVEWVGQMGSTWDVLSEAVSFSPGRLCTDLSVYDFTPKSLKRAVPIAGKLELEQDGSNLAIVLDNIIKNKDKERKFSNLMRDILPFVTRLNVKKLAGKSLFVQLREMYARNKPLPAFLISDGTLNIAASIVALFFERSRLAIIEEPEKSMHPHLMSRLLDMMKDASLTKQIIVTTHNPEIVKYSGLDHLLLVSRDKQGFSTVYRPGDKKQVKVFLQKKMGVEELYVDNLLEMP